MFSVKVRARVEGCCNICNTLGFVYNEEAESGCDQCT